MANFILDDGWTEDGYVKPRPRLHDGCRFAYRPCLFKEATAYSESLRTLSPVEQDEKAAELVAARLVSWDLTYTARDGKKLPVPRDAKSLERVQRMLFTDILSVILGVQAPDEAPGMKPAELAELRGDRAKAEADGLPFRPKPAPKEAAGVGG